MLEENINVLYQKDFYIGIGNSNGTERFLKDYIVALVVSMLLTYLRPFHLTYAHVPRLFQSSSMCLLLCLSFTLR